jgi:hypothetical protein
LHWFVLKAFPFRFYPVWNKKIIMNYYSRTIDIILNKNYVSMLSFSGVFNPLGFYRGSVWIVLGSAGIEQGSAWVNRGSSGVIQEQPGKHRHEPQLHLGSVWMIRSASWVVSRELP